MLGGLDDAIEKVSSRCVELKEILDTKAFRTELETS